MPALGINPSGDIAWLALVTDDGDVEASPDRFAMPKRPRPEALLSALEDIRTLLAAHDVDKVAVVDAQGNARPASFQQARPRFTLELLFEIAAARSEIDYECLAPATIQARLGLGSRRLDDHTDTAVKAAGSRWDKRGRAALAALAAVRKES